MIGGRLALIVALAAVGLGLGACGRKAAPRSPDDAFYPRTYPARPKDEVAAPLPGAYGQPQQPSSDVMSQQQFDPSYPQAKESTGTQ